jgi:uncharacterized membrane protein YhiD involved in acid resistance
MTMESSVFEVLQSLNDQSAAVPPSQIAAALGLSLILSFAIAAVYRITHRGASYSQSYAHTLIIMAIVISAIMVIVGSSIARAFSLVGAMSIIRFRNAVKETRDIGFIFVVMAIGMACGTRFYTLAALMTLVISGVLMLLYRGNLFGKANASRILCVRMPADRDHESALRPVFAQFLDDSSLVSMESVASGTLLELVYSVVLKASAEPQQMLQRLRSANENQKVSLLLGQHEVDL